MILYGNVFFVHLLLEIFFPDELPKSASVAFVQESILIPKSLFGAGKSFFK